MWGASGGGSSSVQIHWLVAGELGTPRIIIDKTGSLANVKRHDYLPFGEELLIGQGSRTAAIGYGGDTLRQKFTQKERDNETGLDYFEARYYSNTQGRLTSADEPFADQEEDDPQSWNLYSYVRNNPLRYIDPFGDARWEKGDDGVEHYVGEKVGEYDKDLNATWDGSKWVFHENNGQDNNVVSQPDTQPLGMPAGVLALTLSPPPVKLAAAGGALVIGAAALVAYLDRDIIHVPAPYVGPIFRPRPPPPPGLKKKGEKRKVRAAARAAGITYVQMRKAIHLYKKQLHLPPNWEISWEDLVMLAEKTKQLLEKRK